jgi:hypothetical protein
VQIKQIISFAIAVFSIGCVRGGRSGNAALTIALPSGNQLRAMSRNREAAQDSSQTNLLYIYVTAPDIATPISYSWSGTGGPPSSVTLDVPQGASRNIQVLLGLDTGSGLTLNYGSATADLASSEGQVDVTVSNLSSGIQGSIVGRYLTSANIGPTDTFNVYYARAGSTLPPLLVQQSEMVGGYFNVLSYSDVPLTYQLGDGTLIFPQASSLNPSAGNPLFPTNNSSAMIYVPPTYTSANSNPVANLLLFGYFGPGVASNTVCYDQISGDIGNAYLNSALSTPLPWITSVTPLSSLLNQAAGVLAGSSLATCEGTALTNYLEIARDNLASGSAAAPFNGPYVMNAANAYLTFTSPGGLTVNWVYAPGVFSGPNAITGSQVFYMTSPPSGKTFETDDHTFDCGNLVNDGFTAAPAVVGSSATSTVLSGLTMASNAEVIVCPYRQNGQTMTYFKHGGDGNPSNMPFTSVGPYHFELTASPPSPGSVVTPLDSIPSNATTPVTVQVVDAQNRAVEVGMGKSITLTLGYPLLHFDNATDTTSVALNSEGQSTFNITVGNNEMMTNLAVSYDGSISGISTSGQLLLPVGPVTGEPTVIFIFTTMVSDSVSAGQCVPVEYAIGQGGTDILQPSAVNINFQPTSEGGTFYTAPDCSGSPASNVTIPAGKVTSYLYFVPSATGNISLNFTGSPMNAASTPLTLYGLGSITIP